jgi:uncharacterized membrane protein (DUF106 family)
MKGVDGDGDGLELGETAVSVLRERMKEFENMKSRFEGDMFYIGRFEEKTSEVSEMNEKMCEVRWLLKLSRG